MYHHHEPHYSRSALIACGMWLAVAAWMSSAWIIMLVDQSHWRWAGLCAASGCATSAAAAVAHIRTYHMATRDLVRATSGLEPHPPEQRRPLGSVR